MKKLVVLSLGGSLIIPNDVNSNFLKKLKQVVLKNTRSHKFIIVCGGGSIARKYMAGLQAVNANDYLKSLIGIACTRTNARFVSYFFNKDPNYGIPHTMESLSKYLKKQDVVFCGALEYKPNQTSDSTSAEIAAHFKTDFINLTNVSGLYTKDPTKYEDAKFIPEISWKGIYEMINKQKFKPGQHFVIDQTAASVILKHKIPTYILGKNLKDLENVLKGKKFNGTIISG